VRDYSRSSLVGAPGGGSHTCGVLPPVVPPSAGTGCGPMWPCPLTILPTSKGRERESIEPRLKRWSEREATRRAFRERRGGSGAAILGGEGKRRGASAHDTGGGWHGGQEAAMAIRVKGRG
jgi:hypothetical protein